MSADISPRNKAPDIVRLASNAIGYIAIAVSCSIVAGLIRGTIFHNGSIEELVALYTVYFAPLFSFFIARETTIERCKANPKWVEDCLSPFGRDLPLLTLLLSISVSALFLWAMSRAGMFSAINMPYHLFKTAASILPFAVIWVHNYYGMKKNNFEKTLSFQQKVLIPALATCLMPFSFGWDMGHEPSPLDSTLYAAAIMSLLVFASQKMSTPRLMCLLAAICAIFIGLSIADYVDFAPVLLLGIAISLSLGVSEVGKRVHIAHSDGESNCADEDVHFYSAGSNWASVVFPPLLFIPALFMPKFNLSMGAIFSFVVMHMAMWFFSKKKESSLWWGLYLISGFSLIAFIFASLAYKDIIYIPILDGAAKNIADGDVRDISSAMGLIAILLTFQVPLLGGSFVYAYNRKLAIFRNETHSDKSENAVLFFLVTSFFGTAMGFLTFIGAFTYKIDKAALLYFVAYYILTQGVMTLAFIINLIFPPFGGKPVLKSKSSENDHSSDEGKMNRTSLPRSIARDAKLAFISGRWVLGVIITIIVSAYAYHFSTAAIGAYLRGIPLALVTMAGFVLNDIFDIDKDRRAGVSRPITDGMLSIRKAYVFAALFIAIGVGVELAISSAECVFVMVLTAVGVALYSPTSKAFPLSKTVFTAILTTAPFFYGAALYSVPVPIPAVALCVIFVTMREALMDTVEVDGDLKSGIKTIGLYMGPFYGRLFPWLGMAISLGMSYFVVETKVSSIIVLAGLASLLAAWGISRKNEDFAIYLTRVPMLLASISIPLAYL